MKGISQASFTLLAKPSGAACNLACRYCFYLGKRRLYPGSPLQMTDEVLEAYIQQLLASQPGGEVSIAWQGGEPTLMGLDFFQRSIELVKKYSKPGQRVSYSLQTNGTLLNDEWCRFFKANNFLIGLSLDGPAEMHDVYRVNKAGLGSYAQVRSGWEMLQKHNVDTNILCAVHACNAPRPLDAYRFFRDDLKARFIQFIPIVERVNAAASSEVGTDGPINGAEMVSSRSVRPEQYGTFLVAIFDEWVHRDVGTIFIQIFDSALASWCRLPASVCTFQEICGSSLILEHNGDLYACDHFVEPAHRLGNILEKPLAEMALSVQQQRFGRDKRDQLPVSCQKCELLFACHGECPRNRFVRSSQGEEGLNYLCPSYKLLFRHIDQPMRTMARLLRSGKAPAEIMRMV